MVFTRITARGLIFEFSAERTMDAHEVTCVCVCVCMCEGRDALFMQEIVKLYPVSKKGRMALLGHFKGELGCKVLLNFSPN